MYCYNQTVVRISYAHDLVLIDVNTNQDQQLWIVLRKAVTGATVDSRYLEVEGTR